MKYAIIALLLTGCGEHTVTGPAECEVIVTDSGHQLDCQDDQKPEHAERKL